MAPWQSGLLYGSAKPWFIGSNPIGALKLFLSHEPRVHPKRITNSVRESLNLNSGFFLFPLIFNTILIQPKQMKNLSSFFIQMKKIQILTLLAATLLLAWCFNSNNTVTEIDAENWISNEWLSVQEMFNAQIEQTQYIIDSNDFLSYEIWSEMEDKSYTAEYSISAKFDSNSPIQWWVEFSQNKVSKSHNLESSEISFDIDTTMKNWELDPFAASGNVSLLSQDNSKYLMLHKFWLYMWENNMTAKMYSLLLDMLKDKWVDLEMDNSSIMSVTSDFKFSYLIWSIESLLEVWDVQPEEVFIEKVSELIDAINSYIDLWVYIDGLTLTSSDNLQYAELGDWSIQKSFTWSFLGTYSSFDMSFIASKKWIDIYFYNIKQLDTNTQEFKEINIENFFSIQENKKSEYNVKFWSVVDWEKTVNMEWILKYTTPIKLSAKFELTPNNILTWEKISWDLNGSITKKSSNGKESIPELTWTILLLSELMDSL